MDSGNSGSMQSSSGGDEEYDSRAESISPFLNSSGHFGSISNPQPPSLSRHQGHPPTLFDPPSHNLHAFSHSPPNPNANTLYNLDLAWSRGLRSDPNYIDLGNLTGLSSSAAATSLSSSPQSFLGAQGLNQGSFPSSSSIPLRSVDGNAARASPQPDQHQTNVVKNPKKRTRASRRAPTTVLTTDTSNFRQMVQEFTGIPAAPFSGSPYSRRFDLFGAGSAVRSGHLDTLGPLYPLRPSAQKVQLSPYASSSSSPSFFNSSVIDATAPTTNISSNTNNTVTTSIAAGSSNTLGSGSHNYQLPSDHLGLPKQSDNVLNMQNQILTFQSLLQSPLAPTLKHPSGNATTFGTKCQGSSSIASLEDHLAMSHQHVNANLSGLPSHGSPSGTQVRNDNNLARWRDGGASNDGGQEHLGSFDGSNSNSQHVGGYKLNSSASASNFLPDKGLENVSSRGEGTVDSWICSSD